MKTLVFVYILFFSIALTESLPPKWVLWNVGQGLMASKITSNKCYHFDAGGEFIDKKKFLKLCGTKQNIFSFTHWDFDHINLVRQLKRLSFNSCMLTPPNGIPNKKKEKFIVLNKCESHIKKMANVYTPRKFKNSNQASRVYYTDKIIIPGDGDKKSEKKYLKLVNDQRLLVLAHHGSKMSTSKRFIKKLKNLKMAFSSARKKRYNHPHPEVKKLLTQFGVSLVRTEVWGNIIFYD